MNTFLLLAGGKSGGGMEQLFFILLIIVVFYFFMIRPQMKKAKDLKKFRNELDKGSKIITIGGIHGKIVDIKDTTFTIEVENGVRLQIEKNAVSMDKSGQFNDQQK